MKLTSKETTKAVAKYARKHGFSASTVRACTSLRYAAIAEMEPTAREIAALKRIGNAK